MVEKPMATSYEDALEYYEYNQLGAYVGERTPGFLIRDYELYD